MVGSFGFCSPLAVPWTSFALVGGAIDGGADGHAADGAEPRDTTRPDPEAAWLQAARGGDSAAFGRIVERHQRRLTAHLRRLVGPSDALDLAQETFVRAWERLPLYDPSYRFLGWLLVIGTRLALNHRRRLRHELPTLADCDAVGGAATSPLELVDRQDAASRAVARLEQLLATLGPEARSLYELRFRQELGNDELAAHFGVREGAIKVRVHRLRQALIAGMEAPDGRA